MYGGDKIKRFTETRNWLDIKYGHLVSPRRNFNIDGRVTVAISMIN